LTYEGNEHMSEISAMPAAVAAWLGSVPALSGVRFITVYPAAKKAVPLQKSVVAVGIEDITVTDSFTANDQGVLIRDEYCRQAAVKLGFDIHVPFSAGGAACYDIFTDIIDCLSFETDLNIIESGCGEITADRDTDAFVLGANALVSASLCPGQSGTPFGSFLDKELLCGSHVRDAGIHVTQADKDLWNAPFASGSYFGNGAATRVIEAGFTPRLAAVWALQVPPVTVDFTAQTTESRFGIACAAGGSQGIELTAGGFRLLSGSSYQVGNCLPKFNEAGVTYCYIAVR